MAGRDSDRGESVSKTFRARRRRVVVGATAGAFLAAAAMATGTAPSAEADILDSILDPILQPVVTSLTDVLSSIDPAAVTDLTSLIDMSGLSLSTVDPAAAVAAAAGPAALAAGDTVCTSGCDIPLSIASLPGNAVTEPYVNAAVDGGPQLPMLVDTGSSGLVIPWQDLGSNDFSAFLKLLELGFPVNFGESGYSGGVDYVYLTYNDVTVDYSNGALTTVNTPVDVEIFSWPTSFSSPADFQQFLQDDGVEGILGIGSTATGPGTSPFEAAGYNGVLVDEQAGQLVVGANTAATANDVTLSGAPLTNLEVSLNGGTPVLVSGDIDSGGVYGTIPSNVLTADGITGSTVPSGTTITVYGDVNGTETPLYSYVTNAADTNAPTVVSSGSTMDTGYEPFSLAPIYLDYNTDQTIFDLPATP
jgi:hypothetical protein